MLDPRDWAGEGTRLRPGGRQAQDQALRRAGPRFIKHRAQRIDETAVFRTFGDERWPNCYLAKRFAN